jgi:SAM-dependent methyltransferase
MVCPRCRRVEAGQLRVAPLAPGEVWSARGDEIEEGALRCTDPRCGFAHPVIDGIPVVLADPGPWWQDARRRMTRAAVRTSELAELLEDRLPVSRRLPPEEDVGRIGCNMAAHYGAGEPAPRGKGSSPSPPWERLVSSLRAGDGEQTFRRSLDLGCGVGRMAFELARLSDVAVGLDSDLECLRRARRVQRTGVAEWRGLAGARRLSSRRVAFAAPPNAEFMVADALDPPFEAGGFDAVTAVNLLDSVRVPTTLLGQMNGLLARGGRLLTACPYAWRADVTPPEEWLDWGDGDEADIVRGILEGRVLPQLGCRLRILEEQREVPWPLVHHARYQSVFSLHVLCAAKDGEA